MLKLAIPSVAMGALIVVVLSVFLPIAFDMIAYAVVFGAGWYISRKRNSPD